MELRRGGSGGWWNEEWSFGEVEMMTEENDEIESERGDDGGNDGGEPEMVAEGNDFLSLILRNIFHCSTFCLNFFCISSTISPLFSFLILVLLFRYVYCLFLIFIPSLHIFLTFQSLLFINKIF